MIYWLNNNEIIPLKKRGKKMKDINSEEEEKIIITDYNEQKVGLREEKIIEYRYSQHIRHNAIYEILL